MPEALLLILAYTAFLGLTLFYRGRTLQGPWWFLLRSFLPNWRFYHRVGALPVLYVRTRDPTGPWQPWEGVVPRARRHPLHLFHNAPNNRLLLDQSLVEHLHADCRDIESGDQLEQLVSYRLVCNLARNRALRHYPNAAQFQFEVRLVPPYGAARADTATLTSPVMRLADHEPHTR